MTKEQYRRANKLVFPIILIMLVYMAFAMVGAVLIGSASAITYIQLVVILSGVGITVTGFLKYRDVKKGSILIVLGGTIAYFIIMCMNTEPMTFLYAFPIMFGSMVYLNARLIFFGNIFVLVGTAAQILRLSITGHMNSAFAFTEGIVVVICVWTCYIAARMLDKFNKENMAVIEEKAKDQMEKANNMTVAAENLMDHFDKARRVISQLSECIDTNNFSMENIAQSTESTADAVQKQAAMCNDITRSTEAAENEISQMMDAAERTLDTVNEGVTLINELRNQSRIVQEASDTTVENTNELTKKIGEVEGIVSAILSISAQTNLLALNASIEAARAGDAGKGFAVVAEEIRQLSEQTKDSVNQITEIINALNAFAKEANRSVDDTIQSVEQQNEMIENSQKKFNVIADEVTALSEFVEKTEAVMKEIFESTNVITENISQLSATSEEVAASSTEGLVTSEEAVKEMHEFNRLLEALDLVAKDLKSYAQVK